jgi:hypothetical protein
VSAGERRQHGGHGRRQPGGVRPELLESSRRPRPPHLHQALTTDNATAALVAQNAYRLQPTASTSQPPGSAIDAMAKMGGIQVRTGSQLQGCELSTRQPFFLLFSPLSQRL